MFALIARSTAQQEVDRSSGISVGPIIILILLLASLLGLTLSWLWKPHYAEATRYALTGVILALLGGVLLAGHLVLTLRETAIQVRNFQSRTEMDNTLASRVQRLRHEVVVLNCTLTPPPSREYEEQLLDALSKNPQITFRRLVSIPTGEKLRWVMQQLSDERITLLLHNLSAFTPRRVPRGNG